MTATAFKRKFASLPPCRVAMEVGAHSRWVSALLTRLGHEVFVADARKLRLIYNNPRKHDRADAEHLARLARLDPKLLSPIHHRNPQAQADLAVLRARDSLVRARTQLINHARGLVKTTGARLPSSSARGFHTKAATTIPDELLPALSPILATITSLTERILAYDREIEQIAEARYPETRLLRHVKGVGPVTSLAYVLTLEDPQRFHNSREVGACLGLVPRRDQSGSREPQLHITPGLARQGRQDRGQLSPPAAGPERPVPPGSLRSGLRTAPLGAPARRARREERQEARGRRGRQKARRPPASPLEERRDLRPLPPFSAQTAVLRTRSGPCQGGRHRTRLAP